MDLKTFLHCALVNATNCISINCTDTFFGAVAAAVLHGPGSFVMFQVLDATAESTVSNVFVQIAILKKV